MPISGRARSGWSARLASRSRRWPGIWGSTKGRWATGLTQTGAGVAMAPARLPGIVEGVVLTPQLPERGEG